MEASGSAPELKAAAVVLFGNLARVTGGAGVVAGMMVSKKCHRNSVVCACGVTTQWRTPQTLRSAYRNP